MTDTPEKLVSLEAIRIDGGTQPRGEIAVETVGEYATAMKSGDTFPPVVVFHDGKDYWLADGFHRYHAARSNNKKKISADVRKGTKRDAVLHSVGANVSHGMRRTNADKRRSVMTLLEDAEWKTWSDREIGRRCEVDGKTVGSLRQTITAEIPQSDTPRTYTTKHGTTATMNTTNIGRDAKKQSNKKMSVSDRVKQFRELADEGHRATQIASIAGVGVEYVRKIAGDHSIDLPDQALGKTKLLNAEKILEETVASVEGLALGLSLVDGDAISKISTEKLSAWHVAMTEGIKPLNRLRKQLSEAIK